MVACAQLDRDRGRVGDRIESCRLVTRRGLAWLRSFDVRILIIYVFVLLIATGMYYGLSLQQRSAHRSDLHFERAIIANCVQVNSANAKFNGVLDQLTTNVNNSTALTPSEKQQALETYGELHLPITVCPR